LSVAVTSAGAVKAAGSTTAGSFRYGQSTVPFGLTNGVLQIAAGLYHSVALKTSTNIVAWGRNDLGQTVVPSALTSGTTITKIASGCNSNHTLALDGTGTVWAWGDNQYGQCGTLAEQYNSDGTKDTLSTTVAVNSLAVNGSKYWKHTPPSGTKYTDIGAGFTHSIVLEKITICTP
jgi:alpha-tubulin suppressor-like RCC1 family protein